MPQEVYDYRSLITNEELSWHAGDGILRYDYVTSTPPAYYRSGGQWDIAGTVFGNADSFAMDAQEQGMMDLAVARWNEVADINLVRGGGNSADIVIGSAAFRPGLFGLAYYPNSDALGRFPTRHGDIWLNHASDQQYIPGVGPVLGHTSWYTYLHELGHALGLSHPNDRPNDPDSNAKYTVMSYVDHPSQRALSPSDAAFPLTPMVWDIQAVQALYGVNTDTRNGSTVYLGSGAGFDPQAERAFQYGSDGLTLRGADGRTRDVILTIWDGGGEDLLDASDFDQDARIDLRPGHFSSLAGKVDNIAVAANQRVDGHVVNFIEQAWGGSGDDWISGNGTHNALRGQAGDDQLRGWAGRDTLDGGAGQDWLVGHRGRDLLRGEDGNDRLEGGAHRDKLVGGGGQDRLAGGQGHDRLRGQSGEDRLWGDTGNDRLWGGPGQDTLNGGQGQDRLVGGSGSDVFVFVGGADEVVDFSARQGDVIDLTRADGIDDFSALNNGPLTETGAGLRITDADGDSLLLHGITRADISAEQFLF